MEQRAARRLPKAKALPGAHRRATDASNPEKGQNNPQSDETIWHTFYKPVKCDFCIAECERNGVNGNAILWRSVNLAVYTLSF